MDITFAPHGIVEISDARIVYRNFRGEAGKFNREGDRNFSVVIPNQEIADALINEGWNVKIKPPREEGDEPFMVLPVKVKFNAKGPRVYLVTGERHNKLDEESIDCLDNIDILSVDLIIRPYDWEVNGKTGRTAYLQTMQVDQDVDNISARFEEIN